MWPSNIGLRELTPHMPGSEPTLTDAAGGVSALSPANENPLHGLQMFPTNVSLLTKDKAEKPVHRQHPLRGGPSFLHRLPNMLLVPELWKFPVNSCG